MDKTALKRKKYLKGLNRIALQRGGKCLSCIYKNSTTPLEWQCAREHKWLMKPSYIKNGSWCKICKKIDLLKGMKKYAESRGGKCLSTIFVTSKTKLLWECSNGHQWYSNSAKYNNSWCPVCTSIFFLSEEKCRFILETITGELFPKTRGVLGNGLELDGYCDNIKTAFEYQGYQHFVRAYYDDDDSFKQRKHKDATKKILCNERNILLLEIPYYINSSESSLCKHILKNLKKNNIKIVTHKIDWNQFISEKHIIRDLNRLACKKGGRLISKSYRGAFSKLEFECQKKHRWFTTPGNIRLEHWCHKCNAEAISQRNRNSIIDVRTLAQEKNSTLISKEYRSNIVPLEWKCNTCLNCWDATLNCMKTRLLNDKWCLFCNN